MQSFDNVTISPEEAERLFDVAAATPDIVKGDLQGFILKLHQWLESLQTDNNETVDMIKTYGTIHFQSICNPGNKLYYSSTIGDCLDTTKRLIKHHGKVDIYMPNLYSICDNLDVLNNDFGGNKIRHLSDKIIDIEWLDRNKRVLELEQVSIEYILGEIESFLQFIFTDLHSDYFTSNKILMTQRTIMRLRNLCIMLYKTIEDKTITKDWIISDFSFPEEIMRK